MKFLMKGLTEGIREAKSNESDILGSVRIELNSLAWQDKGMNYLTQVLQSSEANCISGLSFFDCQFTQGQFKHLLEVLTNCKSLETLWLEFNSLIYREWTSTSKDAPKECHTEEVFFK